MADTNLGLWQSATDNQFKAGQEAYTEAVPDLATANAAALGASNLQGSGATSQAQLAQKLAGRVDSFSGMQDKYAADAFDLNNPAKQQQVADQAVAGVASKFGNLRAQGMRQSERKGVNPGSGAALAMNGQLGIAQATAEAGAASKARNDLELVANDRQKTAIGFGANLGTQSAQAAQVSGMLGDRAAASAAAPLTNKLGFAGGISKLYGNAADGYKGLWSSQNLTAGQLADQSRADNAASSADNAALLGAIGSFAASDTGSKAWDYLVA